MGRFFTLAAFVLLAVVLIVAAIPSFVDWQSYREPIEEAASDALGREVHIAGKVGFTILPRPAVELGEVTIANAEGGLADHLLTLDHLSARLALAPLLRGAVQIETFELEGVDLRLEREGDLVNWDLKSRTEDGSEGKSATDSLLIRAIQDISIEDFSAKDVKVFFTDRLTGKAFGWDIRHGTASLESMNGPFNAEGRIVLGEEAFYVTGKIGTAREGKPRPISLDAVAGNGLSVKYEGALDLTSGAMKAEGDLDLRSPSLNDLAMPFAAITGTSSAAWAGSAKLAMATALKGPMTITGDAIRAPELEITLADQRATAVVDLALGKSITGTIDLESTALDVDAMAAGLEGGAPASAPVGPDVDVEINVRTRSAIVRETRLDNLAFAVYLTRSGPAIGSFDVVLPGRTTARYTLVDAPTHRGTLKLSSTNARAFLDWMGLDLKGAKASAFKSLDLEGDILMTDTEIKMTGLDIRLDDTSIKGAFIRTRTKRPSFGANLEIRELDLSAMGATSDLDDWFDYFSDFDVNAILKLRRFTGFDLEKKSVDLKAQVVGGKLTLEDMQLYGEPSIRLRGKLRREDGKLAGAMRYDASKLNLCAPFQEASGLTVPGCSDDKEWKAGADLDITAGRISGPVNGSAKGLSFDGRLTGVETLFDPSLNLGFKGKGAIQSVSYAVDGRAKGKPGGLTVTSNLETEAKSLGAFLGFFGDMGEWSGVIDATLSNDGTTVASTDITLTPKAVELANLEVLIGSAKINGGGTLAARGAPMDLKLTGSGLSFLTAFEPGKWSRKALDFGLPHGAEGGFALALTNSQIADIYLPMAKLEGRVKTGGLTLAVDEAEAFAGRWTGTFSLNPGKGGPFLLAEGKAQDIVMGDFLTKMLGESSLRGVGNLDFSISAEGPNLASMARSSAGIIKAEVREGNLRGLDIAGLSRGLNDAPGELGARLVTESTLGEGRTDLSLLIAEFTLADGELRTTKFEGDLEGATFSGDGSFNVADFSVEGDARFSLTRHDTLPPFHSRMSGTLEKPKLNWDAEELILKYTEEWLLAEQNQQMAPLPGSQDSAVVEEELGDLAPPAD